MSTSRDLRELLDAIQRYTRFDHPVKQYELVETHISLILLTGQVVYKFKKPVNLGFLDFTTLAKRKLYCEEEYRLNRRYSPQLYLGVVCFTGDACNPQLDSGGEILDYAVKMRQFPKYAELKHVLTNGYLTHTHIDTLADRIAAFHGSATVVPDTLYPGSFGCVRQQAIGNFQAFNSVNMSFCKQQDPLKDQLSAIEEWVVVALHELQPLFRLRKHNGYVRECHGDLHLDNIVLYEDQPCLFDCVEFSTELRMIDVISDVAFLFMDFDSKDRSDAAWRFLNGYLQHTGDYTGLSVLRFYLIYRAMVRAKVACIRAVQEDVSPEQQQRELDSVRTYLCKAKEYIKDRDVKLLITHGLSGSGKTTVSRQLLERLGAIHIRSDVERKRLHALTVPTSTAAAVEDGIYTPDKSRQTYQWLEYMARQVLEAGYPVIIDAAFLRVTDRQRMHGIAADCNVPFVVLNISASYQALEARIIARSREGSDPSDADVNVLKWQFSNHEPLRKKEMQHAITIDTNAGIDIDDLLLKIRSGSQTAVKQSTGSATLGS